MELPFEEPDMGKGLVAELRAENKRWKEQHVKDVLYYSALEKTNADLREAGRLLVAILETRVWEDKELNACGMRAGESGDVHALRNFSKALEGEYVES